MLRLLFPIVSYGSLLLLLMPATGRGILSAAALFVLGAGGIALAISAGGGVLLEKQTACAAFGCCLYGCVLWPAVL